MKKNIFCLLLITLPLCASYDELEQRIKKEIINCPDKETGQCYVNFKRIIDRAERGIIKNNWASTYAQLTTTEKQNLNRRIVELMQEHCRDKTFRFCIAEADYENVEIKLNSNKPLMKHLQDIVDKDELLKKFTK
ncbi:MAG: hypothetical protein WC707_06495 [Candidatus Babeliaceae bacterium]|jgi:hypothetical protein